MNDDMYASAEVYITAATDLNQLDIRFAGEVRTSALSLTDDVVLGREVRALTAVYRARRDALMAENGEGSR